MASDSRDRMFPRIERIYAAYRAPESQVFSGAAELRERDQLVTLDFIAGTFVSQLKSGRLTLARA